MIDLEALLIAEVPYQYNQAMVDLVLDKAVEEVVYRFLNSTSVGVLNNLFHPDKEIDLKNNFTFYSSIATYPDLEDKVKSSIRRYQPYVLLSRKSLDINQFRLNKINNKDFYEKFDFEFRIYIVEQMKRHSRLERQLKEKPDTQKSVKI